MSGTEPNSSEQAGNIDSPPSSPFNNAEPNRNAEQYDHSPPTSPVNDDAAALSEVSTSSSGTREPCTSPQSSPLKYVRKRPAYGAYKDDPSQPVSNCYFISNFYNPVALLMNKSF